MIETTITFAMITFAVAIFASFATHRLSFWRERHARHVTACVEFRSAVLAELGTVYPNASLWPENIDALLRSRFTALQTAVEKFRPFVPWWQVSFFDRAWRIYRLGADGREIDIQYYGQYRSYNVEGVENGRHYKQDQTLTCKLNFKKNVDRLLLYANET